ncbi:SDR family oxidoreductase [Uliginosibacterium gangwonense]|uniref:SDR family oxidoreductase n=1 Tax=Uliginosibacterium gangwonense TaxID=392736 RepID=UPI000375F350|nr:SDR family oxidoreductase [Uliginosibacterium gangwonense]
MGKTVLVAGASRGIGLEFAVQYAADGWNVIAGCRNPEQARSWLPPSVDLQALDVTDSDSIDALLWHLNDKPLDLLIINAGVSGPDALGFVAPEVQAFDQVMHTNVLGPMSLVQAFGSAVAVEQGVIAVLSSRVGSVELADAANMLTYRCSKAALNMVVKTAACEFGPKGAIVVALHPGWVRTDMGGPNAHLGVTEAVEDLREVIGGLSAGSNGCFFDYTGRSVPW